MLLIHIRLQPEFSDIGYAFIRVITMMVGEVNYGEAFKFLYNNQQLQNAGLTLTILVLFVIVINIAFANLLVSNIYPLCIFYNKKFIMYILRTNKVGLAVGDINEVRQNADISLIQKDLKFIMQVKNYNLFNRIREYIYKPTLEIRNHNTTSMKERVSSVTISSVIKTRLYTINLNP